LGAGKDPSDIRETARRALIGTPQNSGRTFDSDTRKLA